MSSGHILEIYEFEWMPGQSGRKSEEKSTLPDGDWIDDHGILLEDMTLDQLQDFCDRERRRIAGNVNRTRMMIRRLALMNFDTSKSKFLTFTFRENVTDLTEANKEWDKFIKRLRRRYGDFKYLNVIEFQKRGAVHYHMLSDLPYVPQKELLRLWGNGWVYVTKIAHVDNIGAYLIKYMTKETYDERFCGRKAYTCSQGLDRPIVYRGEEAERIIALYDLDQKKEVYTSCYTSEHHGNITYREFNLKRV
ncbi:rolling circle replication-associated protein [Brevibacillus laterosporus]|uniref:rolling circle replication-associated protein n=1 Tax=Brevibacillus laterosporus TaxID=1465 RepID=UPI003D2545E1